MSVCKLTKYSKNYLSTKYIYIYFFFHAPAYSYVKIRDNFVTVWK